MKQIQFDYRNKDMLMQDIRRVKQWCQQNISSAITFEIYSEVLDKTAIDTICSAIQQEIPEAVYSGCTTNGNIMLGELSRSNICIVCTIFEFPDTRVEVMQRYISETSAAEVCDEVVKYVENNPWVKAVEMLITIRGMSMTDITTHLSKVRSDVEVFGGGAFAMDLDEQQAYVFSNDGECTTGAVVFRFIGGDNIFVKTWQITGWKTLGLEHTVTRSHGKTLYELDGQPAFDVYYKYLNIENDKNFFKNSLEFPIIYQKGGSKILRAPTGSGNDGSLAMTANIEEGIKVRMAYGDPETILRIVQEGGYEIAQFQPQMIHIYSCAARRFFWGDMADTETKPFQSVAQTSGFYTSGEFLRKNGELIQHNVTLVIGAFREGNVIVGESNEFEMKGFDISKQVSLISRLANFIDISTAELEEANRKLEAMAVTDGLTGIYNRMKIQQDIIDSVLEYKTDTSLIMIDIDDFKKVNDTYGHDEGDDVLRGLAKLMTDTAAELGVTASIGRWGGEEFMVCITGEDAGRAEQIAEAFRQRFAQLEFDKAGRQTITAGVTKLTAEDDAETLCIRADKALYIGKHDGKNRVVVL
ncbi:MAG: GGDEF domain-containing protein [Ruminococcus sp.]|nr:GGDEF domain-containing protein [Ruminococcus sp.]